MHYTEVNSKFGFFCVGLAYFILLLSFLFVGCGKSPAPESQTLRINMGIEPTTLDPRKARDLYESTLCRMVFEGLTRTAKDGWVELAIAEAVEISEDGCEYVFHLRDALWSDGQPVTSWDFEKSWKTILNPSFPTDIASQLYLIENGKKVKTGELGSEYLGIQTPDEKTLVVRLEQPAPYFLEACTMSSFLPIPRAAEENEDLFSNPQTFVGNGPFLLKSWSHADVIEVEKNPKYWESNHVTLNKIEITIVSNDTEIRMFEENKLDWAGSPLSIIPVDAVKHLKETKKLKVNPLSGTYFLRVNTADPILSNANFRKALALSINREGITKHILQGGQTPARSLVPPEMGLLKEGYFIEENSQPLLDSSLQQLGISKDKLKPLVLSFVAGDRNLSIAQAIQKHWERVLGIPVDLEAVESKVFFQRIRQREYQLAVGSWMADFNDPINFLEVFKYRFGSTNNTQWENPKYIDLLNRSQLSRSQEERMQFMRQAEEILMSELPIIPVFHYAMNYLQQERVEDVALSPVGGIDFRWAHIKER